MHTKMQRHAKILEIIENNNIEKQEEYEARYFLLKLLYNNIFLPEFNDNQFRKIAKDILEWKQNQSSESENKFNGENSS